MKLPAKYRSALSVYETQTAIGLVKRTFEDYLSEALNLRRVSAPLFVDSQSGLNDNLSGTERPVEFDIPATGSRAQIVHSLAKWKRMALGKYGFPAGSGLYTDMNAIRRDEEMDPLHSIYVDQWDWEVVITRAERTEAMLRETVRRIVRAMYDTQKVVMRHFPQLTDMIHPEVSFVTTQELEDLYPALTPEQREQVHVAKHKTAFILQIGDLMKSGNRHGSRSPDYDDWTLNGDIIFWHEPLGCAMELSSMGIRVDEGALDAQLTKAGCDDRRVLPYHRSLLAGEFPLTIGGGIGQSRLCMLLLEKVHLGEVQVSVWDQATVEACEAAGVVLL